MNKELVETVDKILKIGGHTIEDYIREKGLNPDNPVIQAQLLSADETATYLGCSKSQVYRLIDKEILLAVKGISGTKFCKKSLDRLIQEMETANA